MEHQTCPIDRAAPRTFPPQHQDRQPGLEYQMNPRPISECAPPSPKLAGRVALITGGDSGIGRAVAYAFVKEGARVAVAYYNEDRDAQETAEHIRQLGGECLLLRGDLRVPAFAKSCVERTVERWRIGHFGQQPRRPVYPAEHSGYLPRAALSGIPEQCVLVLLLKETLI
ncbi:SDR family NAD(P)-dependent oxidoreductase [uncultured Oscillibacter sp.]|uniref:SDR family NAD(P)-dependent oxidoreductase n=1 Tax=uncultured Oscillibacter sp. TaxID=876091 RepID=UPI00260F73C3|nr:SDR family NAD(P)-dependent oxidoreductase [uncultured Oscillibacter sp.]